MRITSLARLCVFASAVSAVHATGINCNGSSQCSVAGLGGSLKAIGQAINGINPNRWYNNGEQIACANSVCAFLQNTGGAPGKNIPGLVNFLLNHGCKVCGSVPYFYPSDNNLADGALTVNYVSSPCGSGLC